MQNKHKFLYKEIKKNIYKKWPAKHLFNGVNCQAGFLRLVDSCIDAAVQEAEFNASLQAEYIPWRACSPSFCLSNKAGLKFGLDRRAGGWQMNAALAARMWLWNDLSSMQRTSKN